MNKTERLYAVAEALRRAGPGGTTGAALARLLEVSERTIKRDVSALQQAGAPIWAQAGPGGGYVLDAVASLPPVNFSPGQAVATAVALALMPPGSPFAVDAAAARGKVWDAMGPADRARAGELALRVWTDTGAAAPAAGGAGHDGTEHGGHRPGRDGAHGSMPARAPEPGPDARVLRAVEQAIGSSRVLALRYRDASGAESERQVEPIILAFMSPAWYLVAWCRLRRDVRWFRLDRVLGASLTAQTHRPRPVEQAGRPPSSAAPVG